MKIILDNIIFQLQISGGISNYWYQLLNYLKTKPHLEVLFFDDKPTENIFRKLVDLSETENLGYQSIPPPFGRYVNPKLPQVPSKAIFHSSYYRTCQNKNHINVTTVHDFTYEKFKKGPRSMFHKVQKKRAILKSDGIICISENTKKDLLRIVPKATEKQIEVIPHGVSGAFKIVAPTKAALECPSNFSPQSYLIYIGDRKSFYKNFEKAVEICHCTKIPLVIVGGGPLTPNEEHLLEHGYEVPYEHHAKVDNATLNLLYNNAFALLYPSAYEGFGLPVIEAQMAGCPVIALNTSSIPGVAGDGALLVKKNKVQDFVEAVEKLKEGNLRKTLIENGLENSKKFKWENTFIKTLEFYQKLYEK